MIAGDAFCYDFRGFFLESQITVYSLGERSVQVRGSDWYIADGYMRRAKLFRQELQPQQL